MSWLSKITGINLDARRPLRQVERTLRKAGVGELVEDELRKQLTNHLTGSNIDPEHLRQLARAASLAAVAKESRK